MKLIVIDPRRSQTAARAAIHLQPRPGEDVALVAGVINLIISEGLSDTEFLTEHVTGFDELTAAVRPFTPEYVAERADVPVGQLIEAARFVRNTGTRRGMVNAGTGANFAGHGSLLEYLCLCLTTICGAGNAPGSGWCGEHADARVHRQGTGPSAVPGLGIRRATTGARAHRHGRRDADRGPGRRDPARRPGSVKALICIGGNPMAAWPDQRKTLRALESLDLLSPSIPRCR
jgi:anaerobic selenocysteine-containing dehydrogenase